MHKIHHVRISVFIVAFVPYLIIAGSLQDHSRILIQQRQTLQQLCLTNFHQKWHSRHSIYIVYCECNQKIRLGLAETRLGVYGTIIIRYEILIIRTPCLNANVYCYNRYYINSNVYKKFSQILPHECEWLGYVA